MINTPLINIRIGDRVQDVYNSRQRYKFLFSRRLCDRINVIRGTTRQYTEHEQPRDIEQVNYVDIAVEF